MDINGKNITEDRLLEFLRDGTLKLAPLTISQIATAGEIGDIEADALLTLAWRGREYEFVVECKSRSTPRVVEEATGRAQRCAEVTGRQPLILVPYLSNARLSELESAGVSGIDACGNVLLLVPGKLLILRGGKKNKFPESGPIKNAYRGDASLVARALVRRGEFPTVTKIRDYIRDQGGHIAMSTVSKALQRLEDDLIIGREKRQIRLLQDDKLLEKLVANYVPPTISRKFVGKVLKPIEDLVQIAKQDNLLFIATGRASVGNYAVQARGDRFAYYCSDIAVFYNRSPSVIEETDLFPNMELYETQSQLVYFDPGRIEDGFPCASALQTYLELMAGDKRDRETAVQVMGKAEQVVHWLREENPND